ncbi:MAG: sigma 54-interacting transcriptional regulator [Pseudomonadota bacterium]
MNDVTRAGKPAPPSNARQKLLAAASLFEGDFTVDWLVELTGYKAHQILAELQDEVKKTLASPRLGIYSFLSEKKRKPWRARLSGAEEGELLRLVVELMVRDLPEDDAKWFQLSQYLLRVSNGLEQCRLLARAGDVHRRAFQTEKAFQCFHKVLEDLQGLTGEEADCLFLETAIKYSKISTARHGTERVLDMLRHALDRAKARENLPFQAQLEMHLAKNEWLRARYDRAMEHFESGWSLVKGLEDPQAINSITAFGTFFLFWQGRFSEAVESYERSVSDVEHYPQARFPLLGTITAGYCYAQTGQHTQGLGMLDAIRAHCLEKGDLYLASNTLGNIGSIMLDMRKVDDALSYVEQAEKMADEANNRWVWLSTQVILAFAYFLKGDSRKALQHLERFISYSRETQATVQLFPYLLALTWAMKQGRLPEATGLSFEKELERAASSPNIFLNGLGNRYQAFQLAQDGAAPDKVIQAHEESIRRLAESGHQIELARSRLELARYLLNLGGKERAQELTNQAFQVLSSFDEALMADDLHWLINREEGADRMLDEILRLGQELVRIRHSRDLAQRIISTGNRVTGAERGAIFIREEDESGVSRLQLRASKNLTPAQANHPHFATSLKLIGEVAASGQGRITGSGPDDGDAAQAEGVVRSKICVPLTMHDQVVGVLYHDNRLLSSAFKETDLGILSYFAALAAIALDNARAYEEINRLNQQLHREKQYFEEEHLSYLHFDEIVGKSSGIKEVLAQIEQVAGTEASVLITGETGVGKELVARAIQRHGPRQDRPFIGVQLSTLPGELIASELSGHEKGAFTGATQRRIGRFELADGGTLFLDEIGDISPDIQVRLLRVLQTKEFERIGGTQTLSSDFRLIAATNRDLVREIQVGRFRADLYYRLNVFPIHVPPLRRRTEDIPLLAYHFLRLHSAKLGKNVEHIPEREMRKLIHYNWPGNVRELQNVIERGVILSSGPDFRMPELAPTGRAGSDQEDALTLDEVERKHIVRVLDMTGWKVSGSIGAAALLGLHPSTLSFRMKKLGIKRPGKTAQGQG